MAENDESKEPEEPVVRDKRRIDPKTGKVRQPDGEAAQGPEQGAGDGADESGSPTRSADSGSGDDLEHEQVVDTGEGYEGPDVETSLSDADLDFLSGQSNAEDLAAERLADLQRVTAEYANYRKRTEANREIERERAVADTAKAILPVLDDLDRAEKHGDLEGDSPFATIAGKLRAASEKLGLAPFGAVGEPFDHNVHEAIFQQPSPDVTTPTVIDVVEVGYTLGSTLVRAAKVVVAVPA
jgi:molecular chaperone GrpE